jgi:hypothetical protein
MSLYVDFAHSLPEDCAPAPRRAEAGARRDERLGVPGPSDFRRHSRSDLSRCSDELRRCVTRGPGPLKVEPAEVAADVEHLPDEVQARTDP